MVFISIQATIHMFCQVRVVFISYSMKVTGLSDGHYSLGGQSIHGRVSLEDFG